ncbi:DUF632 domain-containing protein/DUF630 domain-containing protein [Cephalotus follicularis]|uniref:DUF632 domain-containing protein/DUF630 domain-containing protein n=1 Tax=Cephalotus follicularis TaxID=3775 RepID=A0A1Q3BVU9_CEPFO|nr:DUF632 domain-containing protein/DUF630 domain-containing protein [Cephalotus follicularis]
MGCNESKIDELPLVTLCRQRRDLIKAASDHRYALAASHVAYFHSLRQVGEAITKFANEDLVIISPDSPLLSLPPNKKKKRPLTSSSDTSISHSIRDDDDRGGSHLDLSSDSEPESNGSGGHIYIHDSPPVEEEEEEQGPPPPVVPYYGYGYNYPQGNGNYGMPYSNTYYMKRSSTPVKTFVYEEPERYGYQNANGFYPDRAYEFSGYPAYPPNAVSGSFFGFSSVMDSPARRQQQPNMAAPPPAPPSPPKVSAWDFLNVFDSGSNNGGGVGGYYPEYSNSRYGYGSTTSSPDSKEVREREGIPDLEDETESEVLRDVFKEKKRMSEEINNKNSGESSSKPVSLQNRNSKEGTFKKSVNLQSVKGKDVKNSSSSSSSIEIKSSSSDIMLTRRSSEEEYAKKKGVSFGVEEVSPTTVDLDSSKLSSSTTLPVHGTRDLQDVVKEIRDEFETASAYGKEVAVLLEVSSLPYQRRSPALKVIFSRILYLIAPSLLSSQYPPNASIRLSSRTIKLAKAYCGEPGKDFNVQSGNLSVTLEKLYAWEKKLYKEVKDEERLRVIYEKKCKKLRILDDRGAESGKIDATQASITKLLTKINICIRGVDAISSRIHKLRDEELRPQLTDLIQGLIRMWSSMLKCHQKQFQAIMESKVRSLKANTGFRRDSGLKATLELEMELLNWCHHFNNWINTQKCYVDSLHEWLLKCLLKEPEETVDGVAPFSPGRMGAPPIFVICEDWYQAMVRISEKGVTNALHDFASSLHQLWESQDEEQQQRIRAEYISKDFDKRLRTLQMERGRIEDDQEAESVRTAASKGHSGSGVSPLDDLKVDLDSMSKRLKEERTRHKEEERTRHKEAIKLVHMAASSSLQGGLIPIFEALGNFTSEVLRAHEQVRFQSARGS